MDFINSNNSDVIAVTETWHQPDDNNSFIKVVMPPGYKCTTLRGSGVGFLIHADIDFKVLPQPCINTFESYSIQLSMGNTQVIIFTPCTGLLMSSKLVLLQNSAFSLSVLL